MRKLSRQSLHPDLVQAVRESGIPQKALAIHAGYAVRSQLSKALCHPVRVSSLAVDRLRKLASVVGYDGPIFEEGGAR